MTKEQIDSIARSIAQTACDLDYALRRLAELGTDTLADTKLDTVKRELDAMRSTRKDRKEATP